MAGDEVISRMVSQMVRHPQISYVYRELLSHTVGNEIFVRDCPPDLVGILFWRLAESLQEAILIGVARRADGTYEPLLAPPADYRLQGGDKLVYAARDWTQGVAVPHPGEQVWPQPVRRLERFPRDDHRILVLGWSRRIPALLAELASYDNQRFEVTIASRLGLEGRQKQIDHYGLAEDRVQCRQIDTDYTVPDLLEALEPATYDTILCLASEVSETDEDADARTLVAYSILRNAFRHEPKAPRVLIELLDELNVALLDPRDCEYLLSPQILSHMLVQVSLRRELNVVFQELFDSSETEIFFRSFERYGLSTGGELRFPEIEALSRQHTEVALGIFKAEQATEAHGGIYLNPDRRVSWRLEKGDQFVILRR